MLKKEKTVFVLGAGYSADATFPLQDELFGNIKGGFPAIQTSDENLNDNVNAQSALMNHHSRIREFCKRVFPVSEEDQPLEDVFTLLDQVIISRGHFAKYSTREMVEVRESFIAAIIQFLHSKSHDYLESGSILYKRFAAYLLNERIIAGLNGDPLSIISLNWDSLLEDAICSVLRQVDGVKKSDVDYCVYTTPLPGSPHCPSTKQKAAGLFNVKVLKLHGSITWLRCPNSNHIYTGLGAPGNAYEIYLNNRQSPFIAELFPDPREEEKPPILEPYIITPTYSKVFDLPHIQTTWHNAYIELREASKVVFIGYSLPEADYHFRTLLRRAIRTDAQIELVLWKSDKPQDLERDSGDTTRPGTGPPSTMARYRNLFGRERVDPPHARFDGFRAYADSLIPEEIYDQILEQLRGRFAEHQTFLP